MSKSNPGNPIKEGCFLLGSAFLRIGYAAELAAWATHKKRFDEASSFLQYTGMDISTALASNMITPEEAGEMKNCLYQCLDAIGEGRREKVQDALAELKTRVHELAFQKVVECEARPRGEE